MKRKGKTHTAHPVSLRSVCCFSVACTLLLGGYFLRDAACDRLGTPWKRIPEPAPHVRPCQAVMPPATHGGSRGFHRETDGTDHFLVPLLPPALSTATFNSCPHVYAALATHLWPRPHILVQPPSSVQRGLQRRVTLPALLLGITAMGRKRCTQKTLLFTRVSRSKARMSIPGISLLIEDTP